MASYKCIMAHYLPTMNSSDPDLNEVISLLQQNMTLYIEDEEIMDEQARKICCRKTHRAHYILNSI